MELDPFSALVTAHRDLAPEDYQTISDGMVRLLLSEPMLHTIYFGGASGGDTVALQACLYARDTNIPKFVMFIPRRPKFVVFLSRKLIHQHPDTHGISRQTDEVIELGLSRKLGDVFQIRDFQAVDRVQMVLAFWDGIESGGVYNCKKYAEEQGKIVKHIPIIGRNK